MELTAQKENLDKEIKAIRKKIRFLTKDLQQDLNKKLSERKEVNQQIY